MQPLAYIAIMGVQQPGTAVLHTKISNFNLSNQWAQGRCVLGQMPLRKLTQKPWTVFSTLTQNKLIERMDMACTIQTMIGTELAPSLTYTGPAQSHGTSQQRLVMHTAPYSWLLGVCLS